jgi:four helix bundle protein
MLNKNDFPLYQRWYDTLNWILTTVERIPKNARFSLASRIADLALDILEHIVDAIYSKKRLSYLQQVNRKLEKLRILFRLCFDRKYINSKQYQFISLALDEVGKMTGGWIKNETV